MDIALRRITNMAFGYWQSQVLFTLTTAGVFDALAGESRSCAKLAQDLGCDPEVLERTLNAGVALGLLEFSDVLYSNSPVATRLLVTGSDESLASWVRVMGGWLNAWADLGQYVREGLPGEKVDAAGGASQRDFILGMHQFAARSAAAVARAADFDSPRRMIDVGGGAGTYSIEFARAYPHLKVELLDLSPVLEIAHEVIASTEVADNISTSVADYLVDSFGSDSDILMFSNVLHQESESMVVDMLQRALAALRDGGHVIIHSHFLDEQRTGPVFSTLHNLSAVVLWGSGRSYTADEMKALVAQAGFQLEPRLLDVPGSTTQLLIARK